MFNFYGYKVEIIFGQVSTSDSGILEWLDEDFGYFKDEKPISQPSPDLKIEIVDDFPLPTLSRAFSTKMCAAYGWGGTRVCIFDKQTALIQYQSGSTRTVKIKSQSKNLLYEILYNYILSAVGEALELSGFIRLHAFSGLLIGHPPQIFFLAQGQGKSCLAIKALANASVQIYSDEVTLIKDGLIYPFPIRIALLPDACQTLKDHLPKINGRKFIRKVFPEKMLFYVPRQKVGKPASPQIIYVNSEIVFFWSVFWGLGLPQMTEYLVTIKKIPIIIKMALGRVKFLINLYSSGIRVKKLPKNFRDLEIEELLKSQEHK